MSDSKQAKERPARKILRHRIEKQLKRQAEEQRRELLRKRIEIAKEGVRLAALGNTIDSLKKYQQYLLILEMWKKCGRDGLTPDMFDRKRDIYEMVLISGIYWDLCKLYDRAKNMEQLNELNMALKKYVTFSKGFPYQPLSAETLRRYIGSGRCKHKIEFKKAYQTLSGDKCFIATSLVDVCNPATLPKLRAFRDERLAYSRSGRILIRLYYRIGEPTSKILDRCPLPVRRSVAQAIDTLAKHSSS